MTTNTHGHDSVQPMSSPLLRRMRGIPISEKYRGIKFKSDGIIYRGHAGWLVGWSLMSLFSTNTAISETKGQGWRVILLPCEGTLAIY